MKLKIITILAVTLMLTVSCAKEYTYSPPTSDAGKACVAQCQSTQTSCRQTELNRVAKEKEQFEVKAKKEFEQCQHDAKIEFNACRNYATTLSDRGLCEEKICFKDTFYGSANYESCDVEFRNCFQQCGGTVGVME